jgi:hypothetical protein
MAKSTLERLNELPVNSVVLQRYGNGRIGSAYQKVAMWGEQLWWESGSSWPSEASELAEHEFDVLYRPDEETVAA